jgi:hypothetical protein
VQGVIEREKKEREDKNIHGPFIFKGTVVEKANQKVCVTYVP